MVRRWDIAQRTISQITPKEFFMKKAFVLIGMWTALLLFCGTLYAAGGGDEAQTKLMDGNKRFVDGTYGVSDISDVRRKELTKGQHPFAVILSCSDSRVPPELLFDQGLGDLFVVRTAGNTVDTIGIGSLEYGIEHLHAPLLVILGHQGCGAVKATVDAAGKPQKKEKGHPHDSIGAIVAKIMPAVKEAKSRGGDVMEASIQGNIRNVYRELLKKSPILSEMVASKKVKVVLAEYYLDSGEVKILDNR
jgi:carbonic anhydrase